MTRFAWLCGTLLSGVLLLSLPARADNVSWECVKVYAGAPGLCNDTNLPDACNNVINGITEMNSLAGWTTQTVYQDANAWPSDWMDDSLGGFDSYWMDRNQGGTQLHMAVFSGHGTESPDGEPSGNWELALNNNQGGSCLVRAGPPFPRLKFGEASGDGFGVASTVAFVVMDASCSSVSSEVNKVWFSEGDGMLVRAHEGFGFQDTPNDAADRLGDFVALVKGGMGNKDAWLAAGLDCWFGFCDDNNPAAMAKDSTFAGAITKVNTMSLTNWHGFPSLPPAFGFYAYFFAGNGQSCTGGP